MVGTMWQNLPRPPVLRRFLAKASNMTKIGVIRWIHCFGISFTSMGPRSADNIRRERMELSHLSHLVGRDKYKKWMESVNRKTVLGLQFEPGADLGSDWVNLSEGWG